jgi:hypothetical protein
LSRRNPLKTGRLLKTHKRNNRNSTVVKTQKQSLCSIMFMVDHIPHGYVKSKINKQKNPNYKGEVGMMGHK